MTNSMNNKFIEYSEKSGYNNSFIEKFMKRNDFLPKEFGFRKYALDLILKKYNKKIIDFVRDTYSQKEQKNKLAQISKILNPKKLMDKHDYVDNSGTFLSKLPPEMQRAILQHRKDSLTNTDYVWSSYIDCKFVSKKLVNEYKSISESGWYHKMYQIMISIAGSAIKYKYPITSSEISILCRQIDLETGGWYKNRPLEKEAQRALEYVLSSEL